MNLTPWTALPPDERVALVERLWGAPTVVSRGVVHYVADLPGVLATENGEVVGLATYHIVGDECELMTLDSWQPGRGVGTALLEAVVAAARTAGCARLWLITTNDNLNALRFYQKRGFTLAALYVNAVTAARAHKPQIPLLGNDDIPLRDELELERWL